VTVNQSRPEVLHSGLESDDECWWLLRRRMGEMGMIHPHLHHHLPHPMAGTDVSAQPGAYDEQKMGLVGDWLWIWEAARPRIDLRKRAKIAACLLEILSRAAVDE
jgi:hypothetical protein